MAQNNFAPLEGTKVTISNVAGPFRSCQTCGGQSASVNTTPVGMHHGALVCDGCGAYTSWLGRDHLTAMLAQKRADDERRAG